MGRKCCLLLPTVLLMGLMAVASPRSLAAQRVVKPLRSPESIAVGPDGRIYASEVGDYEKYGDGAIVVIEGDRARPFATGLNDPHGLDSYGNYLYSSDNRGQIWRIDMQGKVERFVDATQFPRRIMNFNDIEIDGKGNIYISDSGDWDGRGGAIYRISQDKQITTVLTDEDDYKLVAPNGLLMEGSDKMLVIDWLSGRLLRLDLNTKTLTKVNEGFGYADGLARDRRGRLYASDFNGRLFWLDKPDGEKHPIEVKDMKSAADITVSPDGQWVIVPDWNGNQVIFVPVPK